mmetsp:Transcript_19606/g.45650  ORF Transcript_19606/g.45650 Transcript_19606/m.45650 type:complete len:100 (+) Transcript_19606:191-490(+)
MMKGGMDTTSPAPRDAVSTTTLGSHRLCCPSNRLKRTRSFLSFATENLDETCVPQTVNGKIWANHGHMNQAQFLKLIGVRSLNFVGFPSVTGAKTFCRQ